MNEKLLRFFNVFKGRYISAWPHLEDNTLSLRMPGRSILLNDDGTWELIEDADLDLDDDI